MANHSEGAAQVLRDAKIRGDDIAKDTDLERFQCSSLCVAAEEGPEIKY